MASSSDGSTLLIGAPDRPQRRRRRVAVRHRTPTAMSSRAPSRWAIASTACAANQGQGETSGGRFGSTVALSADGNTALVGAYQDDTSTGIGAVWGFQRATAGANAGQWSQLGTKFTATSACSTNCGFGFSLALSADGTLGMAGGDFANSVAVFDVTGEGLVQQGPALVGNCTSNCANQGTGELGGTTFGRGLALSPDALTAFVGDPSDGAGEGSGMGSAWAFGPPPPTNATAPELSGNLAVGSTLSCSQGSWNNNPTSYAYGWNRDGQAISGSNADTYQVTSDDAGHNLTCTVTASNDYGSASANSEPGAIPPGTTTTTTSTSSSSSTSSSHEHEHDNHDDHADANRAGLHRCPGHRSAAHRRDGHLHRHRRGRWTVGHLELRRRFDRHRRDGYPRLRHRSRLHDHGQRWTRRRAPSTTSWWSTTNRRPPPSRSCATRQPTASPARRRRSPIRSRSSRRRRCPRPDRPRMIRSRASTSGCAATVRPPPRTSPVCPTASAPRRPDCASSAPATCSATAFPTRAATGPTATRSSPRTRSRCRDAPTPRSASARSTRRPPALSPSRSTSGTGP